MKYACTIFHVPSGQCRTLRVPVGERECSVADALLAVRDAEPGLGLLIDGAGKSTFLRGVGTLKNEGALPGCSNWMFTVNGEIAAQGAGSILITAGDLVEWRFVPTVDVM